MIKKRSHKNSSRLTARERAIAVTDWWADKGCIQPALQLSLRIEKALQAHARQALARERLRALGRK